MKRFILLVLLSITSFYSCDSPKNDSPNPEPKAKIMKEDVIFNTSDNIKIKGTFYYNNIEVTKKEPLVILAHQFMSNRSQWKEDFIDSLVSKRYKVIAYDVRNHGESGKAVEDINDILTEKGNAALDIAAIINWAIKRTGIDSTRVAVVGTSVGASLGLYAKYFLGIKTVVCISIGKSSFDEFTTGTDLTMTANIRKTNSAFFICGDKDGSYTEDAKNIYTYYIDEPKDLKYFNSDKHGKDLINQYPDINKMILDWFSKNL
ncbi:MAG: alpha/beta fold hydrolase [Ignavibacteria bacterium]|jgi:pimeloyl-ACP methyl ester carboxylesterase